VTGELSVTDDLDWSPEDQAAFGKLAEELALLTVDPGTDQDETPGDVKDLLAEDDPADTPLQAFATDPSTAPTLAARALAWHEHVHYGLRRIDDPVGAAGLALEHAGQAVRAARRAGASVRHPGHRARAATPRAGPVSL
jgi:hypothetical protein